MSRPTEHFSRQIARAPTAGPISFLNPTTRYLDVTRRGGGGADASTAGEGDVLGAESASSKATSPHGAWHVWRSRDNRKGRHAVQVSPEYHGKAGAEIPKATNTLRESLRGIWKMAVRYPIWDVSYDVATIFTLGSVVWVINGFFVWYPLQNPASEFSGEESMGGGVTAFLGATIFEFGSVLLMLEAVNENRAECFGWALEEALESGKLSLHASHGECQHSHRDKKSFLRGRDHPSAERGVATADDRKGRPWSWWPSWYELRTHYFREIGFLACLSQMVGASIFWIAGLTGLPPILDVLSVPATNGIYWLPQVVGGTGFIVSSLLFMLETQSKWYIPAPKLLGWHIGFWNLVGAIGFTLCGALGFGGDADGIEYALTLSTFIGSWAFLIGSVIQWYESLDKYPVSIESRTSQGPR